MIEFNFMYKDETGQETQTRKTYTDDILEIFPAIELMFSDFYLHLKNCGYSDELIQEMANSQFGEGGL